MINSITLENMSTKVKLTLSNAGDGKFVLEENGIDWGTVKSSIYTYKSSKKIGNQISGIEVESRTIIIAGWIYGTEKQIEETQFWLGTFILPTDEIKIHVKDYYISGHPLSLPQFGKNKQQNNEYMCKFLINLYCPEPEFVSNTKNTVGYATTSPGFSFPFHFEEGGGVNFGTIELSTVQKIVNSSVHSVGGLLKLKCVGTELKNPRFFNIYNPNEFIEINKTMTYGEEIIVNTNYTKEDITGTLDGVSSDYFKYWNFNNTWIQFERGTGYYGVSYEGANNSLEVSVEIESRHYTIEGM